MIKKITTIVLTLFFISVMFGGFLQISMGDNTSDGMTGCPFVSGQETICTMGATDHIGAWKSAFLAVVPTFPLLILAVIGAVILYTTASQHLLIKPNRRLLLLFRYFINRVYTFPSRPLQELFSNGILHPKLF